MTERDKFYRAIREFEQAVSRANDHNGGLGYSVAEYDDLMIKLGSTRQILRSFGKLLPGRAAHDR
jgi:hypothetical protein